MKLEFKLNLKRTTMVAIVSALFNQEDVQSELKQYYNAFVLGEVPSIMFLDVAKHQIKQTFAEKKILDFVKTKVDQNVFASDLYYELLHVVNSIGCSICRWMHYIKNHDVFVDVESEKLYNFFLKEIFFTHYGSIDVEKTARNWLKNAGIDAMKAFEIACLFCFEKDVHELWEKVSDDPQLRDYKSLLSSTELHVLAYWRSLLNDNLKNFMNDLLEEEGNNELNYYDKDLPAELNMFRSSAVVGNFPGVKYFSKKLDEKIKFFELMMNFHFALYFFKKENNFYCEDQHREIIAFITRCFEDEVEDEITTTLKLDDINFKSAYLSMYALVWPWPEFFKNVFESMKKDLDKDDFESLIENIILELNEPGYAGIPIEKMYCLRLLSYIWLRMPTELKTEIDLPSILFLLSLKESKLTIQLFLNDKDVAYKKQDILTDLFYLLLAINPDKDDRTVIMKFVDTFLIPEDWEEDMKKIIRVLYYVFFDKSFETSIVFKKNDQHIYTSKMNLDLVYRFLIYKQNESEWGEKFLNWAFASKKKAKKFKSKFSKPVLKEHLFKCEKDNMMSKHLKIKQHKQFELFCYMLTCCEDEWEDALSTFLNSG